jgi:hypothetical protein
MSLYEILTLEKTPDSTDRLEAGDVIVLPHFRVAIEPNERVLFTPSILASAKNASCYDPRAGRLSGTSLDGARGRAAAMCLRGCITKPPRTPYDALMLQLHDRMKEDAEFQATSPQVRVPFAARTRGSAARTR